MLKAKYGKVPFAVFWDNARMHTCEETRLVASDLGIPLIFNLPYCPQYNGLENLWTFTKAHYKAAVTRHLYTG